MDTPQNNKKYLLTLGEHSELVFMDNLADSKKYGDAYREFAKKNGKEKEWTSVSMLRLYDDQIINGIYYLESFALEGVHLTLVRPDNIDDKILEDVKNHLEDTRDVLSFEVLTYSLGSEQKESAAISKNTRYEMFIEAAGKVADTYGISVEQYFDITLYTNNIDFKNGVKFSQIHDWDEKDEFARKFVDDGKMPICKEVDEYDLGKEDEAVDEFDGEDAEDYTATKEKIKNFTNFLINDGYSKEDIDDISRSGKIDEKRVWSDREDDNTTHVIDLTKVLEQRAEEHLADADVAAMSEADVSREMRKIESSCEELANDTIKNLAKQYAIGTFTSDGEDSEDYDRFLDSDCLEETGLSIWEPFENYSFEKMQDLVESEFDSALNFAKKVIAIQEKSLNVDADVAAMSDSEREAAMDEIGSKSDRSIDLTQ